MNNRYKNTQKIINNTDLYRQFFNNKKLKNVPQYSTFNFGTLSRIQNANLESITHTVEPFDTLYGISQLYYETPEFGWLICYTNGYANETLINVGSQLTIYLPLVSVLELL